MSGFFSSRDRLEAGHDVGGLASMSAGANPEIHVRCGNFQLREENIGQVLVVMLPGMHKRLPHSRAFPQGMEDRSGFHEIWTRADDVQNVHTV